MFRNIGKATALRAAVVSGHFRIGVGVAGDDAECIVQLPGHIELDPATALLADGNAVVGIRRGQVRRQQIGFGQMVEREIGQKTTIEVFRLHADFVLLPLLRIEAFSGRGNAVVGPEGLTPTGIDAQCRRQFIQGTDPRTEGGIVAQRRGEIVFRNRFRRTSSAAGLGLIVATPDQDMGAASDVDLILNIGAVQLVLEHRVVVRARCTGQGGSDQGRIDAVARTRIENVDGKRRIGRFVVTEEGIQRAAIGVIDAEQQTMPYRSLAEGAGEVEVGGIDLLIGKLLEDVTIHRPQIGADRFAERRGRIDESGIAVQISVQEPVLYGPGVVEAMQQIRAELGSPFVIHGIVGITEGSFHGQPDRPIADDGDAVIGLIFLFEMLERCGQPRVARRPPHQARGDQPAIVLAEILESIIGLSCADDAIKQRAVGRDRARAVGLKAPEAERAGGDAAAVLGRFERPFAGDVDEPAGFHPAIHHGSRPFEHLDALDGGTVVFALKRRIDPV